jgi:hypothetical protein
MSNANLTSEDKVKYHYEDDKYKQVLSDFYDYLAEHFEIPLKAQTEIYKQMLIDKFIND